MIRLAVLEDEELMRLSLCAALESKGLQLAISSGNVADFLTQAKHKEFDVGLFDLHLGSGPSGLDAAIALRRIKPGVGIVFLTSFADPRLLDPRLPALPQGSVYLVKRAVTGIEELADQISRAANPLVKNTPQQSRIEGVKLTSTQLETLRLVALGLSNQEIAKQRFVTEKSVETSIRRVAKILGLVAVPNSNQRVQMARAFFQMSGRGFDA